MGKAKRERAREKRDHELERQRQAEEARRRAMRLWMLIGVPVIAAAIVAIVLIGALGGGGSSSSKAGDGTSKAGVKAIAGAPRQGLTLGKESAPVTIREFADLQCPVCRRFSSDVLPKLLPDVKSGKVKITYEPYAILGPDSETAADALLATVSTNQAWDFLETFYANQREENTGYVTDTFIDTIAKTAGVNVATLKDKLRDTSVYEEQRNKVSKTARGFGYKSTPTIRIEGPGGAKTMDDAFDVAAIKSAISDLATK